MYVNKSRRAEVWQQKYNNPLLEAAAYSFALRNYVFNMAILANHSTYSTSGIEDFLTEINIQ